MDQCTYHSEGIMPCKFSVAQLRPVVCYEVTELRIWITPFNTVHAHRYSFEG